MKNDENMKKQRETQQTNDEHIEKTMKNDEHIEKNNEKQKIHAKNIGKNHETAAYCLVHEKMMNTLKKRKK